MKRWIIRISIGLFVLIATAIAAVYYLAVSSIPDLSGNLRHPSLQQTATVERDPRGLTTVKASTRDDLSFALGFAHGQDRFFQMDLQRRDAAGRLSELFGSSALDRDRSTRKHRFESVAEQSFLSLTEREKNWLELYSEGVNAGLKSLGTRPPEYWLLGQKPQPWKAKDTFLVIHSMYLNLQGGEGRQEIARDKLKQTLPESLVRFLDPPGTAWDAPMMGEGELPMPELPSVEEVDLRTHPSWKTWRSEPAASEEAAYLLADPTPVYGSNNFVVGGALTSHGGAILAGDMHLGHGVPNIWYRATLQLTHEDSARAFDISGVTLPGVPTIVAGSNGSIAWAFTNSYGDWHDVIKLKMGENKDTYLTPDGETAFTIHEEVFKVADEPDVVESVRWTRWGPVLASDDEEPEYALRWVAHDPESTNVRLGLLEVTKSTADALELGATLGMPSQNMVVGDASGNIGYVLTGPIPQRVGFSGNYPQDWASGDYRWDGYRPPSDSPRIYNPPHGRIWTANTRVVSPALLSIVGDGGYALGARGKQIRDALFARDQFDETLLYALQLDDRALFLEPWRELLLNLLDDASLSDHPDRMEFRDIIQDQWSGHARKDDVAYRLVRAFRTFTSRKAFDALVAPCQAGEEEIQNHCNYMNHFRQYEHPLWILVSERPLHLLDPHYESWETFLLARVDQTIEYFSEIEDGNLANRTWGERNTVKVDHPMGASIPVVGKFFNMSPRPMDGDRNMPRIQGIRFGASQRLVVAPGRESYGILTMPTGQSGHFLSHHFDDLHDAWAEGRITPLLPGETKKSWTLVPKPE